MLYGSPPASPLLPNSPPRPISSFDKAKVVARDAIYARHAIDFYCGCSYTPAGRSGGVIDLDSCGYRARKNAARAARLEWEHIVPAWFFGHTRTCWKTGNPACVNSNGKTYKGRTCCSKVDPDFAQAEADLHNLTPSVGEANGDRTNLPYGEVPGEPREYGACNFEIGSKPKVAEPRDEVRGDAARVWMYMSETYGVALTAAQEKMFKAWSEADPVDDWERLRDARVKAAQGNANPYLK